MSSAIAKPMAVKLESDLRERLSRLAKARKHTSHFLMREAISEYVEREEQRESFHQEAMQAWEEYRETGLHVTGAEVIEWLKTWGTEHEQAAPLCHR